MKSLMSVKFDESGRLLEICKAEMASLESNPNTQSPIPLIVATAIALEAVLNDAIVLGVNDMFPFSEGKRMAESLLSMSFRGKLNIAPTLASRNQYFIREDSSLHQRLSRLISVRNNLVHSKSYYEDVYHEYVDESTGEGQGFDIASVMKKWDSKPVNTLTLSDARSYLDSVSELNKYLFDEKNDMYKYSDIFKGVHE